MHPTRSSRYVAVNESVVGICGIVGPLSSGLIADHLSLNIPYFTAAAMVVLAFSFNAFIHYKYANQLREARQSITVTKTR